MPYFPFLSRLYRIPWVTEATRLNQAFTGPAGLVHRVADGRFLKRTAVEKTGLSRLPAEKGRCSERLRTAFLSDHGSRQ